MAKTTSYDHGGSRPVVIGVSALYHDSGVAVVGTDGTVHFAAHEERFSRIKHDRRLPFGALSAAKDYCVEHGLQPHAYAYYEDPRLKRQRQAFNLGYMWARRAPKFRSFSSKVWSEREKDQVEAAVRSVFGADVSVDFSQQHHMSHAASAFFTSGYDEAVTLVLDGVGEWDTCSLYHCKGSAVEKIWHKEFPVGLGLFYSAITQLCGFKVNSGEYKLMGLAPYGDPVFFDLIKDRIAPERPAPDFFDLDMSCFDFLRGETMVSSKMLKLFGLTKLPHEGVQQKIHLDIAASAQKVLEWHVGRIVSYFMADTASGNLCMAGGVALNCVNNSAVAALDCVGSLYVQPAAGDAGGALGAALNKASRMQQFKAKPMPVPYLGRCYSKDQVRADLQKLGIENFLTFDSDDEFLDAVVGQLVDYRVGGWFHGRSEFGPRALGGRSILARADDTAMQSRVNLKVKFRESFRPFAPIVLNEDAPQVFDIDGPSPYMLRTYMVKDCEPAGSLKAGRLDEGDILAHLQKTVAPYPAITHVDGSARVQTVGPENGLVYDLLSRFKAETGAGILINTSFNVRGEPIVETPANAISCFLGTDIDFLAMEGTLVCKEDVPKPLLKQSYRNSYDLD